MAALPAPTEAKSVDRVSEPVKRADLRMPALGAAAWLAAIVALKGPPWLAPVTALPLLALLVWTMRRHAGTATVLALLLVSGGVATVAGLHIARVGHGPVPALASAERTVTGTLVVSSDPRHVQGPFADMTLVRGSLREVSGRGRTWRVRAPVVVLADPSWSRVELGSTLWISGKLVPADGDAAALLLARGSAEVTDTPNAWWQGADAVRDSLRRSVSGRPDAQRALVPALVVGDESRINDELAEDFRTTGLTHLLAVSGTNLTLIVGFLLILARWCGIRGRWLYVVGAAGIVGFVLLARTEPSVVRAAAMGSVALLGMGRNGLQRGTRGLGVAVVCLLLVDPWLAVSPGFALSVLATAGILLLAPSWRDAMARWLPRWLAEAISVPAAAQLACTPIVAAISEQVSLVAVVANLLAAPAVGPATVLGLTGGLLGVASAWLGSAAGFCAGWCVAWIVLVARRGASLPSAAVSWDPGAVSLILLTVLCVGLALVAPRLLKRPVTGLACAGLMALSVLVRPPNPGWPPEQWIVAACDVGQGDAVVLRAGPGQGIVVDAGPDPALMDRCLQRLDISAVPIVVLTHFHADHIDGLPGALRNREVGQVLLSPLAEPASGAAVVAAAVAADAVPARIPEVGEQLEVGEVSLQVLAPTERATTSAGESVDGEGGAANNASLVVLVEVRGIRVLLTGDIEPEAQAKLARTYPGMVVDVLKVPHHGSRYQKVDYLLGLRARLALVSVGEGNTYGHPAPDTLGALADTGAEVLRTDTEGDLLVLEESGRLMVRTWE